MKKLLTIILALFLFLPSSCKQESKKENFPQTTEKTVQEENDPLYNDIIGNLKLDENEKNKVKDLTKKNNPKELSDYLNELTLLKFEDKEKLSKIKEYADMYNKKNSNISLDFKECFVFTINGANLEPFDELTKAIDSDNNKRIFEVFDNIKKMFPVEKLSGIKRFMAFTTVPGSVSTAGFITREEDDYVLGVNIDSKIDINSLGYTIYHEYGHFISLDSSQIKSGENKVGNYFKYEDVDFLPGSYMKAFYEKFWKNIEKIHEVVEEKYLFCARHIEDFVSIYSTMNFIEDFAESFGRFILGKDENKTGKIKQKMEFFKNYKELVELKNKINSLCDLNEIYPTSDKTP